MSDAPAAAQLFETEGDRSDGNPSIDKTKNTFEDEDAVREPTSRGSDPRRRLFVLLDEPDSSVLAQVISIVIMLMIFASSCSFVMETTSTVRDDPELKHRLHILETV